MSHGGVVAFGWTGTNELMMMMMIMLMMMTTMMTGCYSCWDSHDVE
jgi:hypothetical protein